MYILGINSAYHEPAACLIKDGRIVAAVEEERFNRVRHGKVADLKNPDEIPTRSILSCLSQAGITAKDVAHIGYSFVPYKRLRHNVGIDEEVFEGVAGSQETEELFQELLLSVPKVLGDLLGDDVSNRFHWLEHHRCHAASAFFVSPFEESAVLSVDGIGEATTTWFGKGLGSKLEVVKELTYPASLGLLWTKMSRFLGFGEYGQWKVMGLAGYGDPDRYYRALRSFVSWDEDGNFAVDPRILQLRVDKYGGFERLFGPHRSEEEEIEDRHEDVAAALQRLTTEAFLAFGTYLHRATGLSKLCFAGGVALNCVANRALVEQGPFDEVFIQPAANDAGTALGAAYYVWNHMLGQERGQVLDHVFLGPDFPATAVSAALEGQAEVEARELGFDEAAARAAELIANGEIVAWFQNRMEFGPRALGNRSILADPRRADIVHLINDKVKHREYFRPFAASVLTEKAAEWFDVSRPSPADSFMLIARRVRPDKLGKIPAVTHVDGTCRLQRVDEKTNPEYHRLLREFELLTGVPAVLNTSFNDREPIICSPEDAIRTCLRAGVRYLVLGSTFVDLGERDDAQHTAEKGLRGALEYPAPYAAVPIMRPFMSR